MPHKKPMPILFRSLWEITLVLLAIFGTNKYNDFMKPDVKLDYGWRLQVFKYVDTDSSSTISLQMDVKTRTIFQGSFFNISNYHNYSFDPNFINCMGVLKLTNIGKSVSKNVSILIGNPSKDSIEIMCSENCEFKKFIYNENNSIYPNRVKLVIDRINPNEIVFVKIKTTVNDIINSEMLTTNNIKDTPLPELISINSEDGNCQVPTLNEYIEIVKSEGKLAKYRLEKAFPNVVMPPGTDSLAFFPFLPVTVIKSVFHTFIPIRLVNYFGDSLKMDIVMFDKK